MIAFASSLDRVGSVYRECDGRGDDARRVLAGNDPLDATSADRPVDDYVGALAKPVAGLKIGVPEEYFGDGLDAEIKACSRSGD